MAPARLYAASRHHAETFGPQQERANERSIPRVREAPSREALTPPFHRNRAVVALRSAFA
jgi:hypothetical protein